MRKRKGRSPAGGRWSTERAGARWGREVKDGTGSGGEGGSRRRAGPEEEVRSDVQVYSDLLRGTCCKAHCRTAGGAQNSKNNRISTLKLKTEVKC